MGRVWRLWLVLVVSGCLGCSRQPTFESLAIRSLADGAGLKRVARLDGADGLRELHAAFEAGVPLDDARPVGKLLNRFEFVRQRGKPLVYDLVGYWPGSTMLVFQHEGVTFSVAIVTVQNACKVAGVSFDRYVLAPSR